MVYFVISSSYRIFVVSVSDFFVPIYIESLSYFCHFYFIFEDIFNCLLKNNFMLQDFIFMQIILFIPLFLITFFWGRWKIIIIFLWRSFTLLRFSILGENLGAIDSYVGSECLDISMWFITISVFCSQISRRKRSVLKLMFLCGRIWKHWNIFSGFCRYSTMNVTKIIGWLDSIWIIQSRCGCLSNLKIFSMVTICCGREEWFLLFSTIILFGPDSFLWTPILFWISFRSNVWLTVYKHTRTYLQ